MANYRKKKPIHECYNTTIPSYNMLPTDIQYNCQLWEYDHQNTTYITHVMMRKMINYAFAGLATMYSYQFLQSEVFAGHQRDALLSAGLVAVPFLAIQNNIAITINYSIYYATGYDLITSFTEDVNNLIGLALYIPNLVKNTISGIFFNNKEEKSESVFTGRSLLSIEDNLIFQEAFSLPEENYANDNYSCLIGQAVDRAS